jgi:hypothetical protein
VFRAHWFVIRCIKYIKMKLKNSKPTYSSWVFVTYNRKPWYFFGLIDFKCLTTGKRASACGGWGGMGTLGFEQCIKN